MDVIIGAGVSGLSYASFADSDYLILEAENEIGGYCRTVKQDGFVWDYSGHFFHFQDKNLQQYACENIPPDTLLACTKQSQIKYKDRYIDFPFQKNIHQLQKQEFIDCLYDLFAAAKPDYSTFKQMLYAKFGKSIANKFLIPYNEKLYACDLDVLDVDAMGRFFPYASKEDIILNFKQTGSQSYNSQSYNSHFVYPQGGAIEYINSIFKRIDSKKLSLNEKAIKISLEQKTITTSKRELRYDNIISTVPFPQLLQMCGVKYNPSVYSWNKVLVFNWGFDGKSDDIANNWVYFPEQQYSFYRIGYYNNIFKTSRMSLYVELGFNKDIQHINVDAYFQAALNDLKKCGIIATQNLISSHFVIMNPAYVHISKASVEDVAHKKELLSQYGIYSIGRYGSWTYCSIEDNIKEAKELKHKLEHKLKQQ
ncbi:MAG: FAD-dependent oxidoreductase [Prevotellaceae bacterium]|jgi:protoporphyrinogen oxidase|nr:FAD-dependent oxidoreductase [Prevotellaceae bacterium]